MKILFKADWEETKERFRKWWAGEYFGRCAIAVTAPKNNRPPIPDPPQAESIEQQYRDLDLISARNDFVMSHTFYGGEALPVWSGGAHRGYTSIPALLGCPIHLDWDTGWSNAILMDEDIRFQRLKINKEDWKYRFSLDTLRRGVKEARGKSLVCIGALDGCGDVLAALRGTERLLFDCVERPEEVRAAGEFLMDIWYEYYDTLLGMIRQADEGSVDWMPLWSPGKFYPAQNDFACNISPKMYRALFLPAIESQTRFLDHCIYHLDGVGNFAHLDALLALIPTLGN